MFSVDKLLHKITMIKDDNKKIYEKTLPKEMLKKFHEIIITICKNTDIIIKGGRSLNIQLDQSIYTKEDLLYADYDLYSPNAKADVLKIAKLIEENNYPYVNIIEIPFKPGIYQLKLYKIPLVDVESVDQKIYEKLPFVKIDNIKYIDPKYMKIDLYSIIARPTYYNIQLWSKTLKRLVMCEKNYLYKKGLIKTIFKNNYINEIIDVLDILDLKELIFTGNYAYNKIVGNIELPYLEILINIDYKIIKKIKTNLEKKGKTFYKKFPAYMYVMQDHYIFYYKNKISLIIWSLNNCSSIINIDGRNYTNEYFLKFYYNFLKYSKIIYPHFNDLTYYDSILDSIKITKPPRNNCIGDINPGVNEFKNYLFFKKNSTFKYKSVNIFD